MGTTYLKRCRRQNGSYLIELLVALAISGFLAVALSASLSEQMRVTTGAENQLKAAEVANQVIERIRESSLPLPNYGSYDIPIDSDDAYGGQFFQTRPLCFDMSKFNYPNIIGDQFIGNGPNGHAVVTATISPGSTDTTTLLTVSVAWIENQANKTSQFVTTISKVPNNTALQPGIHL